MMKKILLVLVTVITFAMNSKRNNSDRLSLGVGCLYQNGLDFTLSYEHEGQIPPHVGVFANGYLKWDMNAPPASISVRNHSGRITAAMGSVSPTSPVWRVVATIMAMSVSEHRPGVTQNGSWAASTSAMNTITCFEVAGAVLPSENRFDDKRKTCSRTGIVLGVKLPLN